MAVRGGLVLLFVGLSAFCLTQGRGPFDWMGHDAFDEIDARMSAVNAKNCRSKPDSELRLPEDTLAQLPRFNKLLSSVIYPNRTNLLHLHNMALNRAFFFSYIFQKLNESYMFQYQPGLMYYYFSTAADISANEYNINGSAVMFDNNCSYANWYRNLRFNHTLELFGPRAWRFDDYNDPTNWLREPTNETIDIIDYGAGPQSNYTNPAFKTNQWYSRWLPDGWDKKGFDSVRKHTYDVGIKYSNETGKFTDKEFQGKTFFGPPSPGQKDTENFPVKFTQPYYDCGRSNKWIVSAVAPVVDQLPRYLEWNHLRRHRFVAVSMMDMDFLSIDINPCPHGLGNELPNKFQSTAKCKRSTMCEPLYGWGFRRGGYQCVCKPGYRYPPWQNGPWQGIDIESATEEEYKRGFDCIPVKLRQLIPIIRSNDTSGTPTYDAAGRKKRAADKNLKKDDDLELIVKRSLHTQTKKVEKLKAMKKKRSVPVQEKKITGTPSFKKVSQILDRRKRFLRLVGLREVKERNKRKLVARYENHVSLKRKKRSIIPRYNGMKAIRKDTTTFFKRKNGAFDPQAFNRMMLIMEHKMLVNKDNCRRYKPEELQLPGDVAYGVEKQFSAQARTALRLSHFLSNFLQNIDIYEEYGNLRGDKLLNVELLFGEVLANTMGDLKLKGSGVFFDTDKFKGPNGKTRQFFGPYAYRYEKTTEGDVANTHYRAVDFAGFETHYLDSPWFKNVKERWQSNTYGLTKFTEKPMIRSDLKGSSLKKFELYPMYYYAPKEEDGWWSAPYFNCDGYVDDWIITYSVPFFGRNTIGSAIEFKGVVTADIKLDELDINQCPSDFYVPNAFKNTARCHFESTECEALPGKKFQRGGYKCECMQGFEYPFSDRAWYFDGQTMEEEYRKKVRGETNRFDTLRCRISAAAKPVFTWQAVTMALLALMIWV